MNCDTRLGSILRREHWFVSQLVFEDNENSNKCLFSMRLHCLNSTRPCIPKPWGWPVFAGSKRGIVEVHVSRFGPFRQTRKNPNLGATREFVQSLTSELRNWSRYAQDDEDIRLLKKYIKIPDNTREALNNGSWIIGRDKEQVGGVGLIDDDNFPHITSTAKVPIT